MSRTYKDLRAFFYYLYLFSFYTGLGRYLFFAKLSNFIEFHEQISSVCNMLLLNVLALCVFLRCILASFALRNVPFDGVECVESVCQRLVAT